MKHLYRITQLIIIAIAIIIATADANATKYTFNDPGAIEASTWNATVQNPTTTDTLIFTGVIHEIATGAFQNCPATIIIGDMYGHIETDAFSDATGPITIGNLIENGIEGIAFENASGPITIGNVEGIIQEVAFYNAFGPITFKNLTGSVSPDAFYYYTGEINVPNKAILDKIKASGFTGTINLPRLKIGGDLIIKDSKVKFGE